MAATFRKGNEGCFACGDKDLLKRDCPKKANKKPPRICPHCRRGIHWAKDCKSKLDLKGNLFQKTPNRGPPPPPGPCQRKPGTNFTFSPLPSSSPF